MATKKLIHIPKEKFSVLKNFIRTSPNYGSLDFKKKVTTVVLHWTAGSNLNNDISHIRTTSFGYHFIIEKNGTITQCKPITQRTSHAGKSYGPQGSGVNQYSVSIAFTNSYKGIEEGDWTDEQVESTILLLMELKGNIPDLEWITGHHWISPKRKSDPYTFPFNKLISDKRIVGEGFKLWKTGQPPFPKGLTDCKCLERRSDGTCKKSQGFCGDNEGNSYKPEGLTKIVFDESFQSDRLGE